MNEIEHMLENAFHAAHNGYSPYSGLKVGACVKSRNMEDYVNGCNVENASYGLTTCAEANAISSMVFYSLPKPKITRIAICMREEKSGETVIKRVTPCGACLQMIAEFGDSSTEIYTLRSRKSRLEKLPILTYDRYTLGELLPYHFKL